MAYVTADRSLPRSLDVQIQLSRAQTETRTDFSTMVVALPDLGFEPTNSRVKFYYTIEAIEEDFNPGTEAHNAASAFFAQSPRPVKMALGEVFDTDQPAILKGGWLTAAEISALLLVDDGTLTLLSTELNNSDDITGLDFTGETDIDGIASVLQTAFAALYNGLTCTAVSGVIDGATVYQLVINCPLASLTNYYLHVAAKVSEGTTNVAPLLKLTDTTLSENWQYYVYVGLGDELSSIQNAAYNQGVYLYGWCLGASLRTVENQKAAALWMSSRTGIMPLVTNDSTAYDPDITTDIGPEISATGNKRVVCIYHDNAQRYPDVSILAYMLHVNYRLQDSTVTAKFKVLPGVETVQLTETQWTVLQNKGYNTYTAIGNDARTYRDGNTSSTGWWMDTVINLDNFVEDLSVNVYNVFLRNKKVPYTRAGQMLLVDACKDVGYIYTYNGTFADREEFDITKKSGNKIIPAVQVLPTNIGLMTADQRAARIGPPIQMICQEAGAIHSVAINVEVVS